MKALKEWVYTCKGRLAYIFILSLYFAKVNGQVRSDIYAYVLKAGNGFEKMTKEEFLKADSINLNEGELLGYGVTITCSTCHGFYYQPIGGNKLEGSFIDTVKNHEKCFLSFDGLKILNKQDTFYIKPFFIQLQ